VMLKPKFQEIWKWGIIATLTFILGVAMNDIEKLQIGLKYFWILSLAISFFLSLAIVEVIWILAPKFTEWIKTPNPKNLHLYPGSLHGDIFTLKFISTEWRYLFHKTNVFVNTQSLVPMGADLPDGGKNIESREQKTTEPIFAKRFVAHEFNFLQIDEKKNRFWVNTENNEQFKFSPGEYGFKIGVAASVFGNFKVKNKSLNSIGIKDIGFKHIRREIYLIVNYKSHDQISLKITNKEDYEQKIWYKQWQENQEDNP
jgi:hypothetical protein